MSPRAKSPAKDAKPATQRKRKKKAEAGSVGLAATEVAAGSPPGTIAPLRDRIEAGGGAVLATYREPFGGNWVALAALPLDRIKPTPYQRELSKAHTDRLAAVIPKVGRFLDPVIAVADPDGTGFITPNGMHRLPPLAAPRARALIALGLPEPEIAVPIPGPHTRKAPNPQEQ